MRHHRRRHHARRHGPHRLHRRIFRWFGVAILLTFVATRAVLAWTASHDRWGLSAALLLLVVGGVLWSLSLVVARHLTRPLRHIAAVAERIGGGDLGARVEHRPPGELGVLAERIDEMAARIERQLADQKALLAAVSHEIRTPLGHMRIVLDTVKETGLTPRALEDLESEVLEIDDLVGELLAHSRLEFEATDRRRVDAVDAARRALERAGLPPSLLVAPEAPLDVMGDATLLARALANLLSNAVHHGGGPTAVRVRRDDAWVEIAVEDAGPGFAAARLESAFTPFRPGPGGHGDDDGRAGLGLGLSLVRRIAEAHGGDARARNLVSGGCQVALRLPAA